jgi:hypothetical protein
MKCRLLLMFFLINCFSCYVNGQTNIGGTINAYANVISFNPTCANKFTVAGTTGFAAGNAIIVIQMKGAVIDEANASSFGTINAYNSAGLWEKAFIASITGNEITLTNNLLNTYNAADNVQMVLLPTYANAITSSVITGESWNGTTGGVIALEVSGTLMLDHSIDALGIGFRGGANTQVCPNTCNAFLNNNAYSYATGNYRGALKGEGVASVIMGKELGRGAQANGGGGGNDHNNGGGGGGNYLAGGQGGNNNDPNTLGCKGNNNYGRGGVALNYAGLNRLFAGGGGGAGHGNNGSTGGCSNEGASGTGGNGGGIVIVIANTLINNGSVIVANGLGGGLGNGDGAGGGGAGGAVFLSVASFVNPLGISINGGNGGNSEHDGANRCFGPGGGGGAGVVISTFPLPNNVNILSTGGTAGIIVNSSNACNGTTSSANAGGTTTNPLSNATIPLSVAEPTTSCKSTVPVRFIYVRGKVTTYKSVLLEWATSFEQHADKYIIEKSANGTLFTEVGIVAAVGNSNREVRYTFTDNNPMYGVNYYRIKQVDLDGTYEYTNIIFVIITDNGFVKNVYPNPVSKESVITIAFETAISSYNYKLTDMSGRVVIHGNRSNINALTDKVTLTGISAGVYTLALVNSNKWYYSKLIVY